MILCSLKSFQLSFTSLNWFKNRPGVDTVWVISRKTLAGCNTPLMSRDQAGLCTADQLPVGGSACSMLQCYTLLQSILDQLWMERSGLSSQMLLQRWTPEMQPDFMPSSSRRFLSACGPLSVSDWNITAFPYQIKTLGGNKMFIFMLELHCYTHLWM